MTRTCFFCHKPLSVEQRATIFCSLRCQQLEARLRDTTPVSAQRSTGPQVSPGRVWPGQPKGA